MLLQLYWNISRITQSVREELETEISDIGMCKRNKVFTQLLPLHELPKNRWNGKET